jgi:type IV pilus assembly protein PilW
MQLLQDDIQLAGYYGEYSNAFTVPAALPDPCSVATPTANDVAFPVQGYDFSVAGATLPGCIANQSHMSGTDVLVIRRVDPTVSIPVASATPGQIYLQTGIDSTSGLFSYKFGVGPNAVLFTLQNKDGTVANVRPYVVHIYFISPCSVPAGGSNCTGGGDDNGSPIPTLKRLELTVSGGAMAFTTASLAEGIENLQVDYGIDTDNDGSPDYYTTGTYEKDGVTAMTPTDWSNVMSTTVNLLARNTDSSSGYTTTKQYNLGLAGNVGPYSDNYKRHVFNGTVRLINPSSRREK